MSRYIWAFLAIGLAVGTVIGFALLRPNHQEPDRRHPTETEQPDTPDSEVKLSSPVDDTTAGG